MNTTCAYAQGNPKQIRAAIARSRAPVLTNTANQRSFVNTECSGSPARAHPQFLAHPPHACSLEHLIWLPDPAQRGEARAAEVELMAEWLVSNFGFGYVRPLPSGSDREVAFLPSALTDQK